MTEKAVSSQRFPTLRIILVLFGVTIMIVGFIADELGYGKPGSLGIGQLLLILTGIAVAFMGVMRSSFINLYKGVAIILLNMLLLLAFMELGSIIIIRAGLLPSYRETIFNEYRALPYYQAQDWADVLWHEAPQAESYHYVPYVVWRHRPFKGETVNIDQQGVRQTTGADCSADAFSVFTFGGSSMWGWGSPDWGTIAAYLQTGFESLIDGPICVVNLGEDSFVSTQSVVELMRQLQLGSIPDAVVFYDGANDVYVAYESGEPGVHSRLASIAGALDGEGHPLVGWLKSSRLYSLAKRMVYNLAQNSWGNDAENLDGRALDVETSRLANSVTYTYLGNYRIVKALAAEYDFDFFFFWQPHIALGEKILTQDEKTMRSRMDSALVTLAKAVYAQIALEAAEYDLMWYIADVLDAQDAQIWIDEWGHVTPEGNRLVAEEMISLIEEQLTEE